MRRTPLPWLLVLTLAVLLPACTDGVSIGDDDDVLDDDVVDDDVGDDDAGDDDTGDDDTGDDDDTTAAPPDTLAFEEVIGGHGGPAFSLGGELYVVYGGQILRRVTAASWDVMVDTSPDGLNCRKSFNVEVLGGKGYIIGGHYQPDENCTEDAMGASDKVWVYDPGTNQLDPAPPLLHAREVLASGVAGGAIYVLGGWNPVEDDQGANIDVVERFDGASWSSVSTSGEYVPIRSPAYATVGDRIFLFGGCEPGLESDLECPCNSQKVQEFDTVGATFSQLPDSPMYGRHYSGQHAQARGQYVYVFGGATGFSCVMFDDVARFDTSDHSWEILPDPMTTERKGIGSVIHQDQLYVFGGISCPEQGCDGDACDHPGTIPNCPFTGAGTNEIGTFVAE